MRVNNISTTWLCIPVILIGIIIITMPLYVGFDHYILLYLGLGAGITTIGIVGKFKKSVFAFLSTSILFIFIGGGFIFAGLIFGDSPPIWEFIGSGIALMGIGITLSIQEWKKNKPKTEDYK